MRRYITLVTNECYHLIVWCFKKNCLSTKNGKPSDDDEVAQKLDEARQLLASAAFARLLSALAGRIIKGWKC
jgi:hypothetical protein